MATTWRSKGAAGVAATLLLVSISGEAAARGSCLITQSAASSHSEVNSALASFGGRVVAVGRVDAVSRQQGVDVLGIRVMPGAYDNFQVGDYAVVLDWTMKGSTDRILEVRPLSSRYVPGVSEVFLKSKMSSNDSLRAHVGLGSIRVDYSNAAFSVERNAKAGSTLAIKGTQPLPNGVVLSSCVSILRDRSLGTGRAEGSLGTGKQDGSLGTGRAEGSLGTGRTDGSLGTGWADGSLGTGKVDGSLGTGKPAGSLGTGRAEGSLGTGRVDGSLGTGRVDGSLGTGRAEGSLGTGKQDGSLGTGRAEG